MMFPFTHYLPNGYYRSNNNPYAYNKNYLPTYSKVEHEAANEPKKEDKNTVFEIFGISLEFDDLLILGLLFFLYMEDVKDYNLYMVLVLLLLS